MLTALAMSTAFAQTETLSFTIDNSSIYPGTTRTIKVRVPKEYDGKTPACLAIMMDDIMYGLTDAIDQLAGEGKMPVTIAVGVTPGKILDKDGNVIRYNRSNEFDRTDGVFASFLETEVLPEVQKLKTSDGRMILLSGDPKDRMTLGASSGAIAAFAAAWNRPDLFSRVYSIVGTFVPMRGADMLPGIVRKTEPKRIRFYLQDNDKDSWNLLFGSWYEYNLLMNSALEFAGYEIEHSWDEGGHNGNNGAAHMKEALEFLWKGWPERVGLGESGNQTLNAITGEYRPWDRLKFASADLEDEWNRNVASVEAIYPGGDHVAVVEPASNWVMNYTRAEDGTLSNGEEFYYLDEPACAVQFDNEGYLYCLTSLGIEACDHNGRGRAIIPTPYGRRVEAFRIFGGSLQVRCDNGEYFTKPIKRAGVLDPLTAPAPESEGQG